MKTRRFWLRGASVALLLALLALPAAGQQLALLRVESLDGAFADLETLAEAVGTEFERGAVLGPAMQQFGIDDPSILDFKRPLVMVLPMEGMMLQQKGLVAAFPVTDSEKVFAALAAGFSGHEEIEGLHTYSNEAGPALFALGRDGYVIAGGTSDLVKRFDLGVGLDRGDAPPGNIMLDLYLEPVAPMLQMGLMQGKEQLKSHLETAGGDADSPIQPADMKGFVDVYATLVQNVLNNVSRIQMSVQLDGSYTLLHERLVPKAGSTLAELVGAQKAGFPGSAGLVDSKAPMVSVSSLKLTPRFREALKTFVGDYLTAVRPIIHRVGPGFLGELPEGKEAGPALDSLMDQVQSSVDRMIDCIRGDGASSFDFAGEGGFAMVEAYGWETTEACRKFPQEQMKLWGEITASFPKLNEFVTYSDGGTVAGATVFAFNMDMKRLAEVMGEGDAEVAEMTEIFEKVYGEGISGRTAYVDDLALAVAGSDADAKLQALIAKRGQVGLKGLAPSDFAPLGSGAGVFVRLDMGRFLQNVRSWMPEEERNDPEFNQVVEVFSGPAGRIPFGLVFDGGGASGQIAVPMATIEAIGKMAAEEEAPDEQAGEEGE